MTLNAWVGRSLLAITLVSLPAGATAQARAPLSLARLVALYEVELGTNELFERDLRPAKRASQSSLSSLSGTVSYSIDDPGAVIVRQLDPGHASPMAAVGDSLTLITNEGRTARVPVLGRGRYRSAMKCEGTSYLNRVGGWLYAVAPIPALAPEQHRRGMAVASSLSQGELTLPIAKPAPAMPIMAPLRALIAKSAVAAVSSQATDQRSGAAIRRRLLGPRGLGPIGSRVEDVLERTLILHGPGGTPLQFGSVSLDDDPGDHGNATKATIIVDSRGTVILNVPRYFQTIAVADLDGDGVSEVLTDSGIIRWDGRSWRLPTEVKGTCD